MAQAILSGADFALILRRFVRRHPDRGYGGMFRRWAADEKAGACGSWGNGAPMRAAAVGWLSHDLDEAYRMAAEQARVSHDHPDAVAATQAVAHAIHALRYGDSVASVTGELEERFGYDLTSPASVPVGFDVSAAGTVTSALRAALGSASWEEAVRAAIGLGGDTDTLACIPDGVAEAMHGVPEVLARPARTYLTDDLLSVLAKFVRANR